VNNAVLFITPQITYSFTIVLLLFWFLLSFITKKKGINWKLAGGKSSKVKKLNIQVHLFFVGLIITLWIPIVIDFDKIYDPKSSDAIQHTDTLKTFHLAGIITDEARRPLQNARITIIDLDSTYVDSTSVSGTFRFQISSYNARHISLIAEKEGYDTYTSDPLLGNEKIEFNLKKND
jgi:hypothetical protein